MNGDILGLLKNVYECIFYEDYYKIILQNKRLEEVWFN